MRQAGRTVLQKSKRIMTEQNICLLDPFRYKIDPRLYPALAAMWVEETNIFSVFEEALSFLDNNSNPLKILSKNLDHYKKLSKLFGEAAGDSPEHFRSLLRSALHYSHFFKEVGASIGVSLLSPKTALKNFKEQIAALINEYHSLIRPKAKVWEGEGIFNENGCKLDTINKAFLSKRIARFYAGKLLKDDDLEYENKGEEPLVRQEAHRPVIVYVVTIGSLIDNACMELGEKKEASNAYLLNAIGAGAADTAAYDLNLHFNDKYFDGGTGKAFRRMSPGYDDWSIDDQRKIFSILKPEKDLGVVLNEGAIMIPEKSTSGIMSVKEV
jgi:hypothetical protein